VVGHRRGFHLAEVARPAAAVDLGVAVQDLLVHAIFGDTDAVVLARHGREVEDEEEAVLVGNALVGDDALLPVAEVDPREAAGLVVPIGERLDRNLMLQAAVLGVSC